MKNLKFVKWLDKYLEISIISVTLIIVTVVMTLQIISRKVFGNSLSWSEELCRHMFIIMSTWGLSLTIRESSAIKFELLVNVFSKKIKRIILIITYVIMILFYGSMLQPAWNVTISMLNTSATMMPYSMSIVYAAAFASFVLACIRLIQMIILSIREFGNAQNNDRIEEV